jgi:hypothetical protein
VRPFSDWLADVDRRLERRTGERCVSNRATEAYWLAAYHCNESAQHAADMFLEESR